MTKWFRQPDPALPILQKANQQASLEGYIKLTGVNRASLEELLKDFLSFARQNQVEVWGKEEVVGKVREIGEVWEILKKTPKKLQQSLEVKFVKEGGFRENLFKKRLQRKQNNFQ